MITVVNCRTHKRCEWDVRIHRPDILGNPYRMRCEEERAVVIERFREYAQRMMADDTEFRRRVRCLARWHRAGRELHLVCFCAPLPCHGDVLKELIEGGAL